MLARGALCRLAAEVPKQATHDVPKLATLVQTARNGFALPLRTLSHVSQLQVRAYATTKAATTPTATVKKAVKAKAAAGKSVKRTTTAKKDAPKKAAPKKAKKEAAPKKPVVKKAKKPKKELTPEQELKTAITKLRVLALKEPVSRRGVTAFNVYIAENLKGTTGITDKIGSDAKGFKDITPAERERYNHLAAERNVARAAEYKAWVESFTPDQIRIANNARSQLRKKLPPLKSGSKHAHTTQLVDERQVKRPVNAWIYFCGQRNASSDFTGISIGERSKLISGEWKALTANEKRAYEDRAAADKQRYTREASTSAASSN